MRRSILSKFLVIGTVSLALNVQAGLAPLLDVKAVPVHKLTENEVYLHLKQNIKGLNLKDSPKKLTKVILRFAKKYHIEPGLILSVVKVESNFQNWAVSPKGAMGLMQLMPDTAAWMAPRCGIHWRGTASLFEPETNLQFGACYLSYLQKEFQGDLRKVLAAYNQGPGKVLDDLNNGREIFLGYYNKVKFYLTEWNSRMNEVFEEARLVSMNSNGEAI